MASILICCTSEDSDAATGLGAALAGRGFRVWYIAEAAKDPDWLSALHIYEGVVVLWSSTSVASEELRDVARAALAAKRLIQVRAETLTAERLPVEFRNLGTPFMGEVKSISDVNGIASLLAQLRAPPAPPTLRRSVASDWAAPEVGAAERGVTRSGAARYSVATPTSRRPMDIGGGPGRLYSNRPEGVGAADVAQPRVAVAAAPQQVALAVEAGRLVHKIPQKMWVGAQETVEVRLGRAEAEGLTQGLVGRGALSSQDIPILETMSVSLYAKGGTFDIERQSETTQLVSGSGQLKGTPFEQAAFGRWIWLVTPRKTGAHMLFVRVSASLKDSRGLPSSASLPDREFPVSVSVHAGKASIRILRRGLLGFGGAVGAGLLGAITQDLWWPKLRMLLESWGWLG
jgi:hypothetical protein